jgi:hypothetical protein
MCVRTIFFFFSYLLVRTYTERFDHADSKKKFNSHNIFPSSGLLRGVRWSETDVSGLPIGPIFMGQVNNFYLHYLQKVLTSLLRTRFWERSTAFKMPVPISQQTNFHLNLCSSCDT